MGRLWSAGKSSFSLVSLTTRRCGFLFLSFLTVSTPWTIMESLGIFGCFLVSLYGRPPHCSASLYLQLTPFFAQFLQTGRSRPHLIPSFKHNSHEVRDLASIFNDLRQPNQIIRCLLMNNGIDQVLGYAFFMPFLQAVYLHSLKRSLLSLITNYILVIGRYICRFFSFG